MGEIPYVILFALVALTADAQTNITPRQIVRQAPRQAFIRGTNETVLILAVEPLGAFSKCSILSGKIRKVIVADGLPKAAAQHFSDLAKMQAQAAQLSAFVTAETKRLKWQATQLPSEAGTYGVETPAMRAIRKFNEDTANLETKAEALRDLVDTIKEVIADAPEVTGYPTGQFHYNLPVWDFRK